VIVTGIVCATMSGRRAERRKRRTALAQFGALSVLAALLAEPLAPPAMAAPLENVDDIGPALLQCWRPPAVPDGSAVTLRFSFRRDGSLMGAPRVTFVGLDGTPKAQREFADSAVRAVEDCTPLDLSPQFAATIGGQVYVMQFAIRMQQPTIRQMYA
jgi:hypothetical protein